MGYTVSNPKNTSITHITQVVLVIDNDECTHVVGIGTFDSVLQHIKDNPLDEDGEYRVIIAQQL